MAWGDRRESWRGDAKATRMRAGKMILPIIPTHLRSFALISAAGLGPFFSMGLPGTSQRQAVQVPVTINKKSWGDLIGVSPQRTLG